MHSVLAYIQNIRPLIVKPVFLGVSYIGIL